MTDTTAEGPTQISVTGEGTYTITVGRGLTDRVAEALGERVNKVLIVHTPTVGKLADELRIELQKQFGQVLLAEVPDAESAKRVEVAAFCWQILGQADFTRSDAVIGLGGGAVTDLAGFVAATWLRGVRLVQIPTTVLGMVDAAVGGKTGINTTEGKNLVGAFYAPHAGICDIDLLQTLPKNEILAGFAEVAKYGFIAEPEILDTIERDVDRATDPGSDEFRRLVELSIGVKARVVSEDFREGGLREILNYGHTFGHAVELRENFTWRHGNAVAVGMMFIAHLSHNLGLIDSTLLERHRSILASTGLPTSYAGGVFEELYTGMTRDKKNRDGNIRFVALTGVGEVTRIEGPTRADLEAAYLAISS